MDAHVVFMCQKVLPNPFVLTVPAPARAHALNAGAEPRVTAASASIAEIALREIANGAFDDHELAPFLTDQSARGKAGGACGPPNELGNVGVSGPAGALWRIEPFVELETEKVGERIEGADDGADVNKSL